MDSKNIQSAIDKAIFPIRQELEILLPKFTMIQEEVLGLSVWRKSTDEKLEEIDEKLENIDENIKTLDENLKTLDGNIKTLDGNLKTLNKNFEQATGALDYLVKARKSDEKNTTIHEHTLRNLDLRVTHLEKIVV